MDRKRIVYLVIAGLILFLVINPPWKKSKIQDRISIGKIEVKEFDILKEYIATHHRSPEAYLIDLFQERDVVFLAGISDSWTIKEHVDLVKDMLPALHDRGITRLGVYFALSEDQNDIDRLITSSVFSDEAARELLFNRHVMWGYQEFVDIFESAWGINQNLSPGERPFRIIGLNVRHEWQHLQSQDEVDDPEIRRKILANGIPSVHMAGVIDKEIIQTAQKGLIMIDPPHQFTRYSDPLYRENATASELEELRTAGNIVYDRIGDRSATVLLHYFWRDDEALYRINRPLGGIPDYLMYKMEETYDYSGFDTRGTPFGDIPIDSGLFSDAEGNLRFQDLCDGYILTGPLPEYESVTAIPQFINESNYEEALRNFPAPKKSLPDFADPKDAIGYLNNGIAGQVSDITRRLELFDLENR